MLSIDEQVRKPQPASRVGEAFQKAAHKLYNLVDRCSRAGSIATASALESGPSRTER